MITTYKYKGEERDPVILTARLYTTEGAEIHANHELASCISYKWFKDDLLGGGGVAISEATNKQYTVDLSSVANSGEYYCEIKVGMTGCNDQVTERRRVSIIECLYQIERTFTATNAAGQVSVIAPHYESPIFNNEGNSWIVATGNVICSAMVDNVCTFSQSFTLTDQLPSANSARRGQATLTIGNHICFFGVGQDFIRNTEPDGELLDLEPGPTIKLSTNGDVFTDATAVVTARVEYVLAPGQVAPTIPDGPGEQVVFTSSTGTLPSSSREFDDLPSWKQKFTRSTPQEVIITGTYTDPNGVTVSHSIPVKFLSREGLATTFAGSTAPKLTWLSTPQRTILGTFYPAVLARRTARLNLGVYGRGKWLMTVTIYPWGVDQNLWPPSQDRAVKVSMLNSDSSFRHLGSDDNFNNLEGQTILTAPIAGTGAPVSQDFPFEGIGTFTGKFSLNETIEAEFEDDLNAFVEINITKRD
jgi:hypothetical protein